MLHRPSELHIEKALSRWTLPDSALVSPHHQAVNTVLEVHTSQSARFLRLIPARWRRRVDIDTELAFVQHLAKQGCNVAIPVHSQSGGLVEEVGTWFATMFEAAPGTLPEPGGDAWEETMFRAWGEALAQQHRAALDGFDIPDRTWRRDWRAEPVLVRGMELLRRSDLPVYHAAHRLLASVDHHQEGLGPVGIIHADFGPRNFRWSPAHGVTSFDFDNCCRHWLLYDLAVAQSIVARFPHSEQTLGWIMASYKDRASPPGDPGLLPLLTDLRLLYVLCDRIWVADTFGSDEIVDVLRTFRPRLLRAGDTNR